MHAWSGYGELFVDLDKMSHQDLFERITYYPLSEVVDQDNFDVQLYVRNGTTLLAWEIHED